MDLDHAADEHRDALARVDEIKKANAERLAEARKRVEKTRAALGAAIVEEYLRNGRVGDLALRAGYSRETVRVILRNAGIDPD